MTALAQDQLTSKLNRWLSLPHVMLVLRGTAVLMGGVYVWAAMRSHSMNADGISYLDIGDAYMRGDWDVAVSAVWSPLYSWLVGPLLAMFKPSMRWEFPFVQAVNFAVYILALVSFEYLWRSAWRCQMARLAAIRGLLFWPERAWWLIGYLLFIWATLTQIEIWSVTPDMLMAALLFVAAGLLLRTRAGDVRWSTFAALGLVLGLGYLSKSIMFPISLALLGVALISAENLRQSASRVLGALTIFLAITLPFIYLISVKAGHITFGEAGTITYLRHVNGIPFSHWQGIPPGNGSPMHPSRQVLDHPPIYEFGAPIGGTYPIALDPLYWVEGAETRLNPQRQTGLLLESALFYIDLFVRQFGGIFAGVFILYLSSKIEKPAIRVRVRNWSLALVGLSGLVLYAPVLVEGRYIGAFMLLLMADLLGNISPADRPGARKLITGVTVIIAAVLLANLAYSTLQGYADLQDNPAPATGSMASRPPSWPGEAAQGLQALGIRAGDPVALIGYGFDSYWARLARVHIVAEMLDSDAEPFWNGDDTLRSEVIEAFAGTGAKAVVAEYVPAGTPMAGWRQVNDTNFYIYLIR